MILEVISNLNDSVILWLTPPEKKYYLFLIKWVVWGAQHFSCQSLEPFAALQLSTFSAEWLLGIRMRASACVTASSPTWHCFCSAQDCRAEPGSCWPSGPLLSFSQWIHKKKQVFPALQGRSHRMGQVLPSRIMVTMSQWHTHVHIRAGKNTAPWRTFCWSLHIASAANPTSYLSCVL